MPSSSVLGQNGGIMATLIEIAFGLALLIATLHHYGIVSF